jgi:hypothetical protein
MLSRIGIPRIYQFGQSMSMYFSLASRASHPDQCRVGENASGVAQSFEDEDDDEHEDE